MKIFSVETSCDDTSVAIVENGKTVIAMETVSQNKLHERFGGIVPEVASRNHLDVIYDISEKILSIVDKNIKNSFKSIDAIAATFTPGLIGPLLVGLNFAKGIALASGLKFIGVNHLKAHVAANYIESKNNKIIKPPFLCLLVSGGHTCVIKVKNYIDFEIISQTRDDAVGEVFDKVVRFIKKPGSLASNIDAFAKYEKFEEIKFSIPKIENFNFSFSGMKTQAINYIKLGLNPLEVASSLRYTIFKYLSKNLISLAKKHDIKKIAIAGGVASNLYLRKIISKNCSENFIEFYFPDTKYCTDNAAMIGVQGYYELINGNSSKLDLNAYDSKSKIASELVSI